jgi:tRNA(fMet)-specific endonuclease VapC
MCSPFDVPADAEYGGIRSELEAAGTPLEGTTCCSRRKPGRDRCTVVTANSDDFKRISCLKVENWPV